MDIKQEALTLISQEKIAWEDATAFVTDKVAFQMRNLIRQLRKNYWGIFDSPTDPNTGRKKIWIPLTEYLCEAIVKNIDLDTKDINFRAKIAKSIGLTSLVRNIIKNYLDETYFGEDLDELERNLAVDGTAVWKTIEVKENGKKIAKRLPVDLLNFYIDPIARSIQETGAVIERGVMTLNEFKRMELWDDKDVVTGDSQVNRNDENLTASSATNGVKLVEVWERWGLMPKYFITGKKEDTEFIEGQIVASCSRGKWAIHYIAENKKKIKPYEEVWYTRVSGRWYGKGIAEKVLMLQLYINIITNIRINRSYISQLGIFKIRKGAGITPQMLSRLPANGAIAVNDLNDIEQFVMQEAGAGSYKDEDNARTWAERLTSAFEIATGESLPASTPATNAALQSRSAQSQFVLVKEGIGMFLQRWIKRHLLPILAKNVKIEDIIRYTGETNELRDIDERIVDEIIYKKLEEIKANGLMIDSAQVETERQRALSELSKGKDRFIKLLENIDFSQFDVQVYVTNEEIDKSVLTSNLLSILQFAPEYKETITKQIFDIMGLDGNQLKLPQMPQMGMQGIQQGQPQIPSQRELSPLKQVLTR